MIPPTRLGLIAHRPPRYWLRIEVRRTSLLLTRAKEPRPKSCVPPHDDESSLTFWRSTPMAPSRLRDVVFGLECTLTRTREEGCFGAAQPANRQRHHCQVNLLIVDSPVLLWWPWVSGRSHREAATVLYKLLPTYSSRTSLPAWTPTFAQLHTPRSVSSNSGAIVLTRASRITRSASDRRVWRPMALAMAPDVSAVSLPLQRCCEKLTIFVHVGHIWATAITGVWYSSSIGRARQTRQISLILAPHATAIP